MLLLQPFVLYYLSFCTFLDSRNYIFFPNYLQSFNNYERKLYSVVGLSFHSQSLAQTVYPKSEGFMWILKSTHSPHPHHCLQTHTYTGNKQTYKQTNQPLRKAIKEITFFVIKEIQAFPMELDVKSHSCTRQTSFFDIVLTSTTLSYMTNICLMIKLISLQQVMLWELGTHMQNNEAVPPSHTIYKTIQNG